MANTVIALKKSATPSSVPTNLANGELAINYADGKLYYKAANGAIASISGNEPNYFGAVNASGTLVVADTPGDVFTIEAGTNITITADAINDKITISSTGGDISPAFIQANTARDQANAAFDKANSANVLAFNTGLGANAFTSATIAGANTAVGAGANSYANLVWSRSNTYADTVGVSANAFMIAVQNGSNTAIGTGANAFASATIAGANTAVGAGANAFASVVGTSANAFTSATIAGANTAVGAGANSYANLVWSRSNTYADTIGVSANAYANLVWSRSNTYAAIVGSSANAFTIATIAGANTAVGTGANAFTSATIAGANTAVGAGANAYASIVGTSANTVGIAAFLQANVARTHANAAFGVANTALPNTSGASFSGNLNFPTGNVGIGTTSPASPTKLDVRGVIQGQSYALPNDLGVAQWVKLGTLTIPQGGYTARIRMYMHQGYNAVNTQDFYTDIFFKTSNASSVDGNGFSGNSWYYSHGFNLANITPKWVGNAAGVSASAYDLYINVPAYIQNSHYIVEIVEGVNWTHLGTLGQVDPGSGSSTVCISSVGYNITLGNVGIGRTDPGYKLDIVGTANVSNMLVNGNMVFTTANDGTGSNLDADLLDGQHGSFYSTDTKATAAFDKANTAGTDAVNAFTQANTARTHANAAFLSSNSVNTFSSATFVRLTAASQTITGNVNIVGDLTLSGNTFTIDATRLEVDDPLIYLAANNYSSDIVDIGFIGNYVNATGANVHTGLYREHTDKMYYLFQGYDVEPINNHIGALSNNMTLAVLNADIRTSNLVLGGANAILTIAGVGTAANNFASATIAGANTAVGTAANNFAIATIAGANTAVGAGANSVGIAAFTQANTARNHANAAFATANAALPSSSYTASDVLSKLLTVDGSGSNLDADLLDGQHGSFYSTDTKATAAFASANIALSYRGTITETTAGDNTSNAVRTTGVYTVNYPGASDALIDIGGIGGSSPRIQMRFNYSDEIYFRVARDSEVNFDAAGPFSNRIWHSSNDGAASGLDADLLDGQHGSFYSTDTKATAAFGQANTALTTGQAAFAQANSRVSSVSGTGTVSGLTLSGTVTSSGSLTLGGTLSASVIDNMTDEHRLFNNMGDNHATRTAFDATNPSYNFGWRFVQGSTNGPGVNGAEQYYSEYVGLGNEYLATGAGSFGMQIAYPRNVTEPYIAIRYNESNTLGAWQKISAGNSDKLNGQASTFYSTDTKATAAFGQANTALTTGQAAFAKANSALANTTGTFAGDLTLTGDLYASGGQVYLNTEDTRSKILLYGTTDARYAIGMQSGVTFGGLNDYAMTFQFNNETDRGFWWGHDGHSAAQGAMALTTDGRLTVAKSMRLGFGESDSVDPGTNYTLEVNGSFAAQTKSFVINHPTKPGMMLRYGSLEGPENGVYVRGRLDGKSIIELPDYWWNLIDESTITVNLTPIGRSQDIWVQSTSAYFIYLNQPADCFFTVFAERKDVDKLVVEY